MMLKINNSKGVSTTELLIMMVIVSIIVGAIFDFSISQQKSFVAQGELSDLQQNARIGMDFLTKDLLNTGYGFNSGGGVNSLDVVEGGSNPDSIVIRYSGDFGTEFYHFEPYTDKTVHVNDASGISKGDYVFIENAIGDDNFLEVKTVTLGSGPGGSDTVKFYQQIGGSGYGGSGLEATMKLIKFVIYWIDDSDPNNPKLMKNDDGIITLVATNVENLQAVTYDSTNTPTTTFTDIRSINVSLTAKTQLKDTDSFGGDGHQRNTVVSKVALRNLGLI